MPEEDFFFSQNPSKKNCNDQASVSSLWILVFPYLVGSSSHQWYICCFDQEASNTEDFSL